MKWNQKKNLRIFNKKIFETKTKVFLKKVKEEIKARMISCYYTKAENLTTYAYLNDIYIQLASCWVKLIHRVINQKCSLGSINLPLFPWLLAAEPFRPDGRSFSSYVSHFNIFSYYTRLSRTCLLCSFTRVRPEIIINQFIYSIKLFFNWYKMGYLQEKFFFKKVLPKMIPRFCRNIRITDIVWFFLSKIYNIIEIHRV